MLHVDLNYQWQDFIASYRVEIDKGLHCVTGPSGGGKSTLLAMIGGYLNGKGDIRFDGRSLAELAPFQRPITTLFQSDNLFPQLTVWDNVAIGIVPSRKLTVEQKARVTEALVQVELTGFEHKLPEVLSGGQAQRVAIARILVRNSPILLLDEPFSALDPDLREAMLMLVADLTAKNNWTTLMVTHQPQEAKQLDVPIIRVAEGRVVSFGYAN